MVQNLKINIALLLCMGFVFRILFVNIGVISSLNTLQNNSVIKSHFSTVMKRSKHFDVLSNSIKFEDSLLEICEENPNANKQLKSNLFFLIQILYSLVTDEIKSKFQKTTFDKKISFTPSSRYLIFQTFRI